MNVPGPDERPQRRREYSGAGSTLGLATLIIAVAGLAIWFVELRSDGRNAGNGDGEFGIVALADELNPTGEAPAARTGRAAPDFLLQDLGGEVMRLSELRGRYVLLNFWASWCGPCREETPDLQELQVQSGGPGFTVLGVNMQESSGDAELFASQFGLDYPIALDHDGEVTRAYGITGPPTSFLVDPDGLIVETFIGPLSTESLELIQTELQS